MIGLEKAVQYCREAAENEACGIWVKRQCAKWLEIAENKNDKYMIDLKLVNKVEKILKLCVMPTGLKANSTYYENMVGFQWLFIIAVTCTVYRDNPQKLLYRKGVLEIARKNGKNAIVSPFFIINMILSPNYSEFYSVSSDKEFASRTFNDMTMLIQSSPHLENKFKVHKSYIECLRTKSVMKALAYGKDKGNSLLASCYVADEVATLPTNDILTNMQQSQKNILNPQSVYISTRYPADDIFEEELDNCKKVLSGEKNDDTLFSLLYEPDEEIRKEYLTNDLVLKQSNPLALCIPKNWSDILADREEAKDRPSLLNNYLTKICNIPVKNRDENPYLTMEYWEKCKVELDQIEWTSPVCIGLDMSITTDLTAVSIVMEEDNKFYIKSFGFLPRESLKNRREKIPYEQYDGMYCFINEGAIVSYEFIYDFIMRLSKQMKISKICYDPFNSPLLIDKLKNHFTTEKVDQTIRVMSPLVKQFREFVYKGGIVYYEENPILDYCVSCAVTVPDPKMNEMLDKAKSIKNRGGRIDLLMGTIYAFYGCRRDKVLDWIAQ